MEDRLHNYSSKDSLKRHFHRTYPEFDDHSVCTHPKCPNVVFKLKTNFLNHAALVHGIIMHERTWFEVSGINCMRGVEGDDVCSSENRSKSQSY